MGTLLMDPVPAGDAYRKRSLFRATISLLHRLVTVDGTAGGILLTKLGLESLAKEIWFGK